MQEEKTNFYLDSDHLLQAEVTNTKYGVTVECSFTPTGKTRIPSEKERQKLLESLSEKLRIRIDTPAVATEDETPEALVHLSVDKRQHATVTCDTMGSPAVSFIYNDKPDHSIDLLRIHTRKHSEGKSITQLHTLSTLDMKYAGRLISPLPARKADGGRAEPLAVEGYAELAGVLSQEKFAAIVGQDDPAFGMPHHKTHSEDEVNTVLQARNAALKDPEKFAKVLEDAVMQYRHPDGGLFDGFKEITLSTPWAWEPAHLKVIEEMVPKLEKQLGMRIHIAAALDMNGIPSSVDKKLEEHVSDPHVLSFFQYYVDKAAAAPDGVPAAPQDLDSKIDEYVAGTHKSKPVGGPILREALKGKLKEVYELANEVGNTDGFLPRNMDYIETRLPMLVKSKSVDGIAFTGTEDQPAVALAAQIQKISTVLEQQPENGMTLHLPSGTNTYYIDNLQEMMDYLGGKKTAGWEQAEWPPLARAEGGNKLPFNLNLIGAAEGLTKPALAESLKALAETTPTTVSLNAGRLYEEGKSLAAEKLQYLKQSGVDVLPSMDVAGISGIREEELARVLRDAEVAVRNEAQTRDVRTERPGLPDDLSFPAKDYTKPLVIAMADAHEQRRQLLQEGITYGSPEGKFPIQISGASNSSIGGVKQEDQDELRVTFRTMLQVMDPKKIYFVTGGTNYGIEKIFHEEAAEWNRRNPTKRFDIKGELTNEAAREKQEISKALTHAEIVGPNWHSLSAAPLIRRAEENGLVLCFAGGSVIESMIKAAMQSGMMGQTLLWDTGYDKHTNPENGKVISLASSAMLKDHPIELAHTRFCDGLELIQQIQRRAAFLYPEDAIMVAHADPYKVYAQETCKAQSSPAVGKVSSRGEAQRAHTRALGGAAHTAEGDFKELGSDLAVLGALQSHDINATKALLAYHSQNHDVTDIKLATGKKEAEKTGAIFKYETFEAAMPVNMEASNDLDNVALGYASQAQARFAQQYFGLLLSGSKGLVIDQDIEQRKDGLHYFKANFQQKDIAYIREAARFGLLRAADNNLDAAKALENTIARRNTMQLGITAEDQYAPSSGIFQLFTAEPLLEYFQHNHAEKDRDPAWAKSVSLKNNGMGEDGIASYGETSHTRRMRLSFNKESGVPKEVQDKRKEKDSEQKILQRVGKQGLLAAVAAFADPVLAQEVLERPHARSARKIGGLLARSLAKALSFGVIPGAPAAVLEHGATYLGAGATYTGLLLQDVANSKLISIAEKNDDDVRRRNPRPLTVTTGSANQGIA